MGQLDGYVLGALVEASVDVVGTKRPAGLVKDRVSVDPLVGVPRLLVSVRSELRCLREQQLGGRQTMLVHDLLSGWAETHALLGALDTGSDHEVLRLLIEVEAVLGAGEVLVDLLEVRGKFVAIELGKGVLELKLDLLDEFRVFLLAVRVEKVVNAL